ncbi:MAG: 2,3-bisphosphoglycerate-dependent phosphoglycerate mutase [Candidatus Marinimicrobia bacterium]|nr:2,3-bisphosphoglycerate-dependent phosphoglycerate mutase [Candidatus Neomarinimicrobiota bacterium]|tara:strand:+ start:2397 stop:3056 length:660 start_codon:yes stop_codon:yes gene_type:complete
MKSKLYLIRHGQSIYNLENRFTGWKDVDLTELGTSQAKEAAKLLQDESFDLAFTSNLYRAQKTLDIILGELNMSLDVIKNEALNERDYGDLVSQNKSEAAEKFGEKQVQIWRRSFDTPPPGGESLKMTLERTLPYFNSDIKPHLSDGKNIILSAHGNSIRSIVMDLFNYSSDQILETEVGWCEPLVYTFNDNLEVIDFELKKRPSEPSKSHFPEYKLSN